MTHKTTTHKTKTRQPKASSPKSESTMTKDHFLLTLPEVRGTLRENADLSKTTWFRVGGTADVLYKPSDVEDLRDFLKEKSAGIPLLPLGVGSNLLVRDGGIPGVVVKLGRGFTNIAFHNGFLDVGAGFLDTRLSEIAADEGIQNLEFLSGIPGTIGGALRMNAGCYGTEIKDILECVFVMDPKGKLHTMTATDLGYGYRHCDLPEDWIFVGARFKAPTGDAKLIQEKRTQLLADREAAQPVRERTGGSTFANPDGHSAWKLIDAAGCRGLQVGGAQMSEKHCNFMINTGSATAQDLETLGETVRARVLETSGVDLRWEIKRIGYPASKNHLDAPEMGLKKAA